MRAFRFFLLALLLVFLAGACRAGDGSLQGTPTTTSRPTRRAPTASPATNTPAPALQSSIITHQSQSPTPTAPPTRTPTPTPWPPEPSWIFPDSEVVFSQSAADFDTAAYLEAAGGFLGTYRQYLMITKWTDAPAVIDMVAFENSINPRLLVALLEYQRHCVLGDGGIQDPETFTLAMNAPQAYRHDFYGQLIWAIHELSLGYYGWKDGSLTELTFPDGTTRPLEGALNPGSAALIYLFAQLYAGDAWAQAVDPETGFPALYAQMFGDPWERAAAVEPLVPPDAAQPPLTLPFEPGVKWAYTGGPHPAYESNGPFAALDFAPPTANGGCEPSREWVIAMADGRIVRSEMGIVVQDLDGDGSEHTGWNLVYVHVGTEDRAPAGAYLRAGERVGHPSCEGGRATGTHVHIIRKLNGEWIPADGPLPFVLDGWTAHAGDAPYLGTLTRGTEVITASMFSATASHILRETP